MARSPNALSQDAIGRCFADRNVRGGDLSEGCRLVRRGDPLRRTEMTSGPTAPPELVNPSLRLRPGGLLDMGVNKESGDGKSGVDG